MHRISQGASNRDNHNQHHNPISPIDAKLLSEQKAYDLGRPLYFCVECFEKTGIFAYHKYLDECPYFQ